MAKVDYFYTTMSSMSVSSSMVGSTAKELTSGQMAIPTQEHSSRTNAKAEACILGGTVEPIRASGIKNA